MLPTNPNAREFYVYVWWNDDKEEIFYVGKGTKDRYKNKYERNRWFNNIIKAHNCHPEIIISDLTSDEALKAEAEVEQILRKNGVPLVNATPCGGQPPTASGEENPNYGHYWTNEQKAEASRRFRENGSHAGSRNGRATKTVIVELNKTFDTISECAEFLHTSTENINASIKRGGKCKGYHIEKRVHSQQSL